MTALKVALKKRIKNAKRVALLGIGSELRADDIAGVSVAMQIGAYCNTPLFKKLKNIPKVKVFIGATAPENFTGEIKKFKPSHIIIIDSADLGKKPGTVNLVDIDKAGGVSFCTHKLPVKIMIDYLIKSIVGVEVMLIGIQPKTLDFGKPTSKEVEKSIKDTAQAIKEAIVNVTKS